MDLDKYIKSHCIHPVKVKIWDAYSQSWQYRDCPCGKCLHCKMTHVSEWITRLYAQKKHSKYCYYVSLDYAPFDESNATARQLAAETAAVKHNINKWRTYGLHPLLLCKNHLQDFFKRLRKNTGIKLQYFSCGEYGTHAEGKGYGRPHFHNLIFTNEKMTCRQFIDAWTVDGYQIGRVDFQDLTACVLSGTNPTNVFKYVCKYLQKADFDFEKLATIDFHRAYFESLQYVLDETESLFPKKVPILDEEQKRLNWKEYIKSYSPFVVCSRRPAIGSAYFTENLERFKTQDFRLFGLPEDCVTFPRYYVRRTKESLINFRCIGQVSKKPTSASRVGTLVTLLNFLHSSRLSIDNWSQVAAYDWNLFKCPYETQNIAKGELCLTLNNKCNIIPLREFSFYDARRKFYYQFNGNDYKVWLKFPDRYLFHKNMSVTDVLNMLVPAWTKYHYEVLEPAERSRVLRERELTNLIDSLYPARDGCSSRELFLRDVYARYQQELNKNYKTKLLMSNSKQTL